MLGLYGLEQAPGLLLLHGIHDLLLLGVSWHIWQLLSMSLVWNDLR